MGDGEGGREGGHSEKERIYLFIFFFLLNLFLCFLSLFFISFVSFIIQKINKKAVPKAVARAAELRYDFSRRPDCGYELYQGVCVCVCVLCVVV